MSDLPSDVQAIIREIAEDTRRILEQLDSESHEAAIAVRESFNDQPCAFPQNWCQYACCILGPRIARIFNRGNIDLCEWSGDGTFESHFWLRFDGLDIDITADQFGSDLPSVIVEADSQAHRNHFPDPTTCPLLARRPCAAEFDYALIQLDPAVRTLASRVDAAVLVARLDPHSSSTKNGSMP